MFLLSLITPHMKYIILYARKLQEHNSSDLSPAAIDPPVIEDGVTLHDRVFMRVAHRHAISEAREIGSEKFSSLVKNVFWGD
jgi:hypothetical protein